MDFCEGRALGGNQSESTRSRPVISLGSNDTRIFSANSDFALFKHGTLCSRHGSAIPNAFGIDFKVLLFLYCDEPASGRLCRFKAWHQGKEKRDPKYFLSHSQLHLDVLGVGSGWMDSFAETVIWEPPT